MLALLLFQNKKTTLAFAAFVMVAGRMASLDKQAEIKTVTESKPVAAQITADKKDFDATALAFQQAASAPLPALMNNTRTVTDTDKSEAVRLFTIFQNQTDEQGRRQTPVEQYQTLTKIIDLLGGYVGDRQLKNLGALFITQEQWDTLFAAQSFRALEDLRRNHLSKPPEDIKSIYRHTSLVRTITGNLETVDKRHTYGSIMAQAQISQEHLYKQELLNQGSAYQKIYDVYQSLKIAPDTKKAELAQDLQDYREIVNNGPDKNLIRQLAEFDAHIKMPKAKPPEPLPFGD